MTTRRTPAPRSPTLEEVAEFAGVSRATVSRVINAVPTVDPELRQIVEQAIAATGYVPNHAARSLVTRRTDSVALVISEPDDRHFDDPFLNRIFTDPFLGRVTAGALEVLRPEGIHLVHHAGRRADPPPGRCATCARATSTVCCSSPATSTIRCRSSCATSACRPCSRPGPASRCH